MRTCIANRGLQEAKDSSAIENIVTTHDELFRSATYPDLLASPAAKEVRRYVQALEVGFDLVKRTGLLTANHMIEVQAELEQNDAGFRKLPGITLKDGAGHNGNGRTGRIVNVLYLVNKGLLDTPVLYLSRAIVRNKPAYYRHLQAVRERADAPELWQEWVLYMLAAVEHTAAQTIGTVADIKAALLDYKHRIRAAYRFYSQDLINNLFMHPYTRIEFVERDLEVSRLTATKYLDALAAGEFVHKVKVGRSNYYINRALNAILTRADMTEGAQG